MKTKREWFDSLPVEARADAYKALKTNTANSSLSVYEGHEVVNEKRLSFSHQTLEEALWSGALPHEYNQSINWDEIIQKSEQDTVNGVIDEILADDQHSGELMFKILAFILPFLIVFLLAYLLIGLTPAIAVAIVYPVLKPLISSL